MTEFRFRAYDQGGHVVQEGDSDDKLKASIDVRARATQIFARNEKTGRSEVLRTEPARVTQVVFYGGPPEEEVVVGSVPINEDAGARFTAQVQREEPEA